jgi:hypothetical protein
MVPALKSKGKMKIVMGDGKKGKTRQRALERPYKRYVVVMIVC